MTSPLSVAASGQESGSMSGLDLGDPGRPVDLIFVHANGFNAGTYRFLLEPLARDARILAPDLRGHGRSGLPADPVWRRNWHDFRDDLVALIDAVGGPPVVLAGHSMGAVVALLAAERRQHRVRSVVMFDPVILPRPAALMMSWPLAGRMARRYPLVAGALRRRARFDSREAAIEAYRGRGAFRDWPEQALADYVAEGFRDVEDGVELTCAPGWEASNYAAQGHDPWPVLRRMARPVHILKGERGSTCSLVPGQIADVTVETVPGGTHFFPMIQPEAARAALRRSLSESGQG
ncbi:alpha/beta hydrolase [Brevundimonas sp. BAL450]|jgi:pimeloyl-ACP methyl ester carboxylesterase|nr:MULTISPECIES: alpha/beta hydrolase [Brevundimonas]MBG7614336.1 alpha/beta hydrolase [Brevundimonas sp. BAL450]